MGGDKTGMGVGKRQKSKPFNSVRFSEMQKFNQKYENCLFLMHILILLFILILDAHTLRCVCNMLKADRICKTIY